MPKDRNSNFMNIILSLLKTNSTNTYIKPLNQQYHYPNNITT